MANNTTRPISSLYAESNGLLSRNTIRVYGEYVMAIADKSEITAEERDFIADYVETFEEAIAEMKVVKKTLQSAFNDNFKSASEQVSRPAANNAGTGEDEPRGGEDNDTISSISGQANGGDNPNGGDDGNEGEGGPGAKPNSENNLAVEDQYGPMSSTLVGKPSRAKTINLNCLVIKPATFDGEKPKPRLWIENYRDAIEANGWDDYIAKKYFVTFLSGTAVSWFKHEVRPKLVDDAKFQVIDDAFVKNYLGQSDYQRLSRQVASAVMGKNELVCSFIPRMRDLLILMEPSMPERELIRQITMKLRHEYQNWVAHDGPTTMEELKECCQKVEQGLEACKLVSPNEGPRPNNFNKSSPRGNRFQGGKPGKGNRNGDKPQGNNNDKKGGRKCYKCQRTNHEAKDCFAKTKLDGSAITNNPTSKQKVNAITAQQSVNGQVLTVRRVNMIKHLAQQKLDLGRIDRFVNRLGLLVSSQRDLIHHEISCNGVKVSCMCDSGSFTTVIDSKVVLENGWKLGPIIEPLSGAGGEPLKCVGSVELDIEITINKISKSTRHVVSVVSDLAEPMILGLELMDMFDIVISAKKKRILFEPSSTRPGISLIKQEIVPPKSIKVVQARALTVGTIMAVPLDLGGEVMVGNTVDETDTNVVNLLLMNSGHRKVTLEANTQVATYESVDDQQRNEKRCKVMATFKLDQTDEVIRVGNQLTDEQVDEITNLINQYAAAFSVNGSLGLTSAAEHHIELLDGAKPFAEPLRRRPQAHIDETRRQIRQMLQDGIIRESSSPWASAYVLVKKKSGELRLCVDFRRLNAATKKQVYPLPNTDDCLETLAGKRYFSQIDFTSGFWQLPVAEESRELTAFRTEDGQFEFIRMPFGLTNAPASFQRMINATMSGLKGMNLQVFIDDICLATSTWEEHIELLAKVFSLIIESNLKIKGEKCIFAADRVIFLGHEISSEGIRQDPEKLKALLELPPPTDVSGVKRVLGMFSYYRKFVPSFAMIVEPLTKLTRKNVKFDWGSAQQAAFQKVLTELSRNAVLKHFSHDDPIVVKTDASKAGIAGMLLQRNDGELKLVSCCSRRLCASELNYGISDLEGLAVVYTITRFRHYLLGKHFQILVDHCPLCVLKDKMPTSARLRRWAIVLSEYDFEIIYTKGDLHKDIDCLSRAPVDDATDPYLEHRLYMIKPAEPEKWQQACKDDEALEFLGKAEAGQEGFRLVDEVIYKDGKLYVPRSKRDEVLQAVHASPVAGHGGQFATFERTASDYWWPKMRTDINSLISNCTVCQARKAERAKAAGLMRSFEICEPNSVVAIDCLGKITQTLQGNEHIIVAMDAFTRFVEAKAVQEITGAEFSIFLSEWIGRYGVPKTILTDNAPTFVNKMVADICKIYNVKHKTSAPDHSQGNALAERAIESLQEKLSLISKETRTSPDNWDVVLPVAVLSMNTTCSKSTGYSAYELTFGRQHPIISPSVAIVDTTALDLHAALIKSRLEKSYEHAAVKQTNAQQASKSIYDAKHRNVEFQIGDLVWVKNRKRRAKLEDRFIGPFRVVDRNDVIYTVKKDGQQKAIKRHVSCLKAFSAAEPSSEQVPAEKINQREVAEIDDEIDIPSPEFEPLTPPPERVELPLDGAAPPVLVGELPRDGAEPPVLVDKSPLDGAAPPVLVDELESNLLSINQPNEDVSSAMPPKLTRQPARRKAPAKKALKSVGKHLATALLAMALVMCVAQSSSGMQLNQTDFVIWKETQYSVAQGSVTIHLDMVFSDPCMALYSFRITDVPLHNKIIEECQAKYDKFLNTLFHLKEASDKMSVDNRPKRFIAAFLAGMFVSNTLRTYMDKFVENADFLLISEKIQKLTAMTNATTTLQLALKQGILELNERTLKIEKELHTIPMLTLAANFISIKLEEKTSLVSKLRRDIVRKKFDLDVIRELLDTDWPLNIDDSSVKLLSIERPLNNHLRLRLYSKMKMEGVGVYEIDGFDHWTNLTTNPTLVRYSGDRYILANRTSNCARAVQPARNMFNSCRTPNLRDGHLDKWTAVNHQLTMENTTQVKESWPNLAIYCYPDEIVIENGSPMSCPHYAFELAPNLNWHTSVYTHNASVSQFFMSANPTGIRPFVKHTSNDTPHDEPTKAMKLVIKLAKELEEIRDKPQMSVLHSHWIGLAGIMSWGLLIVLCVIVCCVKLICRRRGTPRAAKATPSTESKPRRSIEPSRKRSVGKRQGFKLNI